jgi:predicted aconitase with swiveling domain
MVLALTEPNGPSSSSSVLLELINSGHAPAAVLLGADAILVVGCLVPKKTRHTTIPVLDTAIQAPLRATRVSINDNCLMVLG